MSNMIISRLLKYNFKKTAEKYDSNSKVYKAQEVNKPQLVLVHHLRFYGTKRSSRHQDGTKDKDMTQTLSLSQTIKFLGFNLSALITCSPNQVFIQLVV